MEIDRLISRHKDGVYLQMVRTCGNYADAEDALAEAILAALASAQRLRNLEHFGAWLLKVSSRCCTRIQVKCRLYRCSSIDDLCDCGLEPISPAPSPLEEVHENQTRDELLLAVASLPTIYQDVYRMRAIANEPTQRVAATLGVSEAVVKTRLHRARAMLRHQLDQCLTSDLENYECPR